MKLLRWTLAGASFYVIYKYAIGNKAKGENVFDSPEGEGAAAAPAEKPARPKRTRAKSAKPAKGG